MGIKILGNITIVDVDISLNECILTFSGKYSVIKLYNNGEQNYKLSSSYTIWGSERAYQSSLNWRNEGDFKPILSAQPFSVDISESQLNGNLMGLLYTKMKEKYPNSVDC